MIGRLRQIFFGGSLKDDRYSYLLEPYEGDELVVLDTETTGLNPKKDSILSIAAVIVKDNKILMNEAFEKYLLPDGDISHESIKIHHIRVCDLKNGENPSEVILSLLDFIRNRPIAGYYIGFDHKIISRYVKELIGIELPNKLIELSSMYYKRYRKSSAYEFVDLKFDTIMDELALPRLGKHDAMNDTLMSAIMYLKLKSMPEYRGAYG